MASQLSGNAMHAHLIAATPLLDYPSPPISALLATRGWCGLPLFERIEAVYDFVRHWMNARASRIRANSWPKLF